MRVVVAMIASQGLVRSENEAELDRKSPRGLSSLPHGLPAAAPRVADKAVPKLRRRDPRSCDRLTTRDHRDRDNCRPDIRFVGVWDTVAAYGGPITEITRAIDNWIFPLSMPDYQLTRSVLCARHALAIDDERDAFQPLLWDEVHEEELANRETSGGGPAAAGLVHRHARRCRRRLSRREPQLRLAPLDDGGSRESRAAHA